MNSIVSHIIVDIFRTERSKLQLSLIVERSMYHQQQLMSEFIGEAVLGIAKEVLQLALKRRKDRLNSIKQEFHRIRLDKVFRR